MSKFNTSLLVSAVSLFILASCSNSFDIKTTEIFKTNILDDDAKMFTYTVIFANHTTTQSKNNSQDAKGKKPKGDKKGRQPSNRREKGDTDGKAKLEAYMLESLEVGLLEKLDDSGYCRKGYFELERILNKTIYTIKGECSESASSEDKKRYLNR